MVSYKKEKVYIKKSLDKGEIVKQRKEIKLVQNSSNWFKYNPFPGPGELLPKYQFYVLFIFFKSSLFCRVLSSINPAFE